VWLFSIHDIYPQFANLTSVPISAGPHLGTRDRGSQALFQLAGLGTALVCAIVGGAITGTAIYLQDVQKVIVKV
jgi:hypothetical protein